MAHEHRLEELDDLGHVRRHHLQLGLLRVRGSGKGPAEDGGDDEGEGEGEGEG